MGSRGSRNWNSKKVRDLRDKLRLSDLQKSVLVGKILGDGSLMPTLTGKSYRLQVEHQLKQEEYVAWTADIFKDWVISGLRYSERNRSVRFRTISHPEITMMRKLFYLGKRKIIPKNIRKLLTHPLSIAVWFMDDGGVSSSKRAVTISTHCFSKKDNKIIIDCLKKNFGIQANLNWDGKGSRLYIPVNNIAKFKQLVAPYILPSMQYKLPLTP